MSPTTASASSSSSTEATRVKHRSDNIHRLALMREHRHGCSSNIAAAAESATDKHKPPNMPYIRMYTAREAVLQLFLLLLLLYVLRRSSCTSCLALQVRPTATCSTAASFAAAAAAILHIFRCCRLAGCLWSTTKANTCASLLPSQQLRLHFNVLWQLLLLLRVVAVALGFGIRTKFCRSTKENTSILSPFLTGVSSGSSAMALNQQEVPCTDKAARGSAV